MDTNDFADKLKDFFSRGALASKNALNKAGEKVQSLSDKSVNKLELRQLENKRDCKYEELGLKLSQMLLEGALVTSDNEDDKKILLNIQEEIKELTSLIVQKERD